MQPYFTACHGSLFQGDALSVLRQMPSVSVQCCVTSPPYWGLRDYGIHGQIGLESSPGEYVDRIAAVMVEVLRVLKDDGTVWLNIGDSYSSGNRKYRDKDSMLPARGMSIRPVSGLAPKNLVGIPWRVAFALQELGFYLRQDIIWHKPNPMPESVRDRCTKAHEYLFLLSKSDKYFFDQDAILEPAAETSIDRMRQDIDGQQGSNRVPGKTNGPMKAVSRSGNKTRKSSAARGCPDGRGSDVCGSVPWEGYMRNRRSVWTVTTQPFREAHFATFPPELIKPCILAGTRPTDVVLDPFLGSGTTAMVARNLGRRWLGIELNPEYCRLALQRIDVNRLMLTELGTKCAGESYAG